MKFNKVDTSFWIDEKVRAWDDKTKFLALYILTNQHRYSEGLYRLPKHYIAGDLSISIEEVDQLLNNLIGNEFIAYDEKNSIILIKRALKYSPLINKNHQKAALKKLTELPKSYLFNEFLKLAEKHNNTFAKYLKKELAEYFIDQDPDVTGDSDAISNGIADGIDDAVNDGMGDSLELELAPALTPTLELAQFNKTFDSDSEMEIIFIENNFDGDNTSNLNNDSAAAAEQTNFEAEKLTKKLIDLILSNNSRARVPEKNIENKLFRKWLDSIEKLNRLGPVGAKEEENKGYSWQEIDEIIEFSQQNDFWKSNILSAQKLRKQVIVLENQMQRNGYQDQAEAKMDMLAELYAEAKGDDLDG
ncbi:hypothetical protein C8C77_12514 [Halanaerobium saccharolyticum]|uniref:Uncharacterized protein n=1 Tax=Halanaerobium saccharolyticum TaxID=43595 RepID=A0A4R7YT52_9FIRM|nr:hypothetical protein [Halanaerobium saccharolyticum]RAK06295.1 hypothetical protein C7958_12412 [Halanaerobium saccharolyticum]TDW00774.1 hypothetical protein C8C77_12514 [Halanaerobium saccharolyticum]TDX52416.1 hypothetical protein C7956_12414 [Halanaerobium saccharolyticum]